MEKLMTECKALRKNQALQKHCKPYTVIVDCDYHYFSTITTLKGFLCDCTFPENFRTFRNAYKGVTINLDL